MLLNYDGPMVVASFVVAILAAYAALFFGAKLAGLGGASRRLWLALGALSMGTGIWTMHFVGMRASPMMADMAYGLGLTVLSWVCAIIASAIALNLIGRDELPRRLFLSASLAMGAGIVAMHYIGMYAMHMSAAPIFDVFYLSVSVVIAIAASGAALAICRWVQQRQGGLAVAIQFLAAVTMAVAICGMHYTGMLGMTYPEGAVPAADNLLRGSWLGLPLALLCGVLLTVAIGVTIADVRYARREKAQIEKEQKWVEAAAFTDAVTGLANRASIEKEILNKIALPDDQQTPFALVYLDVANYRDMSMAHNTQTLNRIVKEIGAAITACVDEATDVTIARYSSGSFMLVIPQPESAQQQFIYRRLRNLEKLTVEDGTPVLWRAGQSLYPETGHSSRRLVRAAMVSKPLREVGDFSQLEDDPTMISAVS